LLVFLLLVFFFQAEDGIRDLTVTGVQTCALPISGFGVSLVERAIIDAWCRARGTTFAHAVRDASLGVRLAAIHSELAGAPRDFGSEERRVGKECRGRWVAGPVRGTRGGSMRSGCI